MRSFGPKSVVAIRAAAPVGPSTRLSVDIEQGPASTAPCERASLNAHAAITPSVAKKGEKATPRPASQMAARVGDLPRVSQS